MLNVAETNIQHVIRIVNPGMCEIKREHACVVAHTHTHTINQNRHMHLTAEQILLAAEGGVAPDGLGTQSLEQHALDLGLLLQHG